MKIIIKFSEDIGLTSLEKDVSANETVENLEILISLNYEKMSECKLVFKGTPLTNKAMPLRQVMDPNGVNEVTVATKSELQAMAQQFGSLVNLFNEYPLYCVGGLVAVIFLVLFIMGGG